MRVKIYDKANRKSTWIFSSMLHQAVSILLQSDACQEKLHGILVMGNSYNIVFRDLNRQLKLYLLQLYLLYYYYS